MRHRLVHLVERTVGVAEFRIERPAVIRTVYQSKECWASVLTHEVEGLRYAHTSVLEARKPVDEFLHRLWLLAERLHQLAAAVAKFAHHTAQCRARAARVDAGVRQRAEQGDGRLRVKADGPRHRDQLAQGAVQIAERKRGLARTDGHHLQHLPGLVCREAKTAHRCTGTRCGAGEVCSDRRCELQDALLHCKDFRLCEAQLGKLRLKVGDLRGRVLRPPSEVDCGIGKRPHLVHRRAQDGRKAGLRRLKVRDSLDRPAKNLERPNYRRNLASNAAHHLPEGLAALLCIVKAAVEVVGLQAQLNPYIS